MKSDGFTKKSMENFSMATLFGFISNLKAIPFIRFATSPPFGLVREKEYGNVPADEYINRFKPHASEFHRVLKSTGSLVIDIGGPWNKGDHCPPTAQTAPPRHH